MTFNCRPSGGASDGLPPPRLPSRGGGGGDPVGQVPCMPGGGLQGPEAGIEGVTGLRHRRTGELLCQWQLRVAHQGYD